MKNTNKGTEYAYGYVYDPYTEKKRTAFPIIIGIISIVLATTMPMAGIIASLLAILIARKSRSGYAWIGIIGLVVSVLSIIVPLLIISSAMDPAMWNTLQEVAGG